MLNKQMVEFLNSFNKLAFAISGGKDSMALLHFAINNLDKSKFFVLTVHHNLRGAEGARDRDFVKDYCKDNGVECLVFEENIREYCEENGYTIEQGARIRRRVIFKEIVDSGKADRVVTAHHKDDQIESILMHIFRGSGIKGLCGMDLDTGIIIRPMLGISSVEIKKYLEDNNIKFVQDSTNFELEYSRNRIRYVVKQEIEKVYPNFGDNLLRLSNISNKMQDYINSKVPEMKEVPGGVSVKVEDLISKDIVASQLIINAVEKISTRVDLESCHIESVFDLLNKDSGKSIQLPFGVIAAREYDCIVFIKSKDSKFDQVSLDYGTFVLGDWQVDVAPIDNGGLRFDMDKTQNAVFRVREKGDIFKRFKGGTKSLGDYLTDIKVPNRLRDGLPIIALGKEVLVVLPYEIADSVAITPDTKRIAYITAERV